MKKIFSGSVGVYCVRNTKNSKRYVGSSRWLCTRKSSHFCNLRKGCSDNIYLQEEYDRYGEKNFIFEVLEYCEKDKLVEREQFWIDFYKSYSRESGYNISITAGVTTFDEISLKKISNAHRGVKRSEEYCKKMSELRKGKGHKMGVGNFLGRKHSEETKKKISLSGKGKIHSEESKQKQREKMTGRKLSEERKQRLREIMMGNTYSKGKNLGKKHSEETKKKMSESAKFRYEKKKLEEFKNEDIDSR